MAAAAHYTWTTADELRFLAQLVDRAAGDREILIRYARTLDLRHDWQRIDPWQIRAALKKHGIDWTPPARCHP